MKIQYQIYFVKYQFVFESISMSESKWTND